MPVRRAHVIPALMARMFIHRMTAAYVALHLAVYPVVMVAAEPVVDFSPPEIVHAPLAEFPAGMPRHIQATVTDNVGVAEVTLLYRGTGETEYRGIRMTRTPGTDMYGTTLPNDVGPRIEYIIQASDASGNRILGQLFEPYVTMVVSKPPPDNLALAPQRTSPVKRETGNSGISRWVWIGLGVVTVAVVAGSAAGGGGGGDNGNGNTGVGTGGGDGNGTGTVTITAPVP